MHVVVRVRLQSFALFKMPCFMWRFETGRGDIFAYVRVFVRKIISLVVYKCFCEVYTVDPH